MTHAFSLRFNAFGELTLTTADGAEHANVEVVRAFPVTAPEEGASLLDQDGHELAWIPSLQKLDEMQSAMIRKKLAAREFMPVILRIVSASTFSTPSTWQVVTDRGKTQVVLKAEDDIRRLAAPTLLVQDSRGIQFLIRDPQALDSASRKILDRFL